MRYFDLKNVAILLDCHPTYIHTLIKKEILTGKKVGRRRIFNENEILKAQEHMQRRKNKKNNGGRKTANNGSVCWDCLRAYNGCSWSRERKPVAGWTAVVVTNNYDSSYIVRSCPLFWLEEWAVDENGRKYRVNEIPEEWKVDPEHQLFDKLGRVKKKSDSEIDAFLKLISEKPYKES